MISQIINRLNKLQGQKELLISQLKSAEQTKKEKQEQYEKTLKAREVFTKVAENTQKTIEFQISNLVSYAIASVFPDPWQFQLSFVQRRNKTEADLIFFKGNEERQTSDILNSGGGGAADIAAFALRPAMWSLKKTAPFFFLDEPTKFLHNPTYQEKASEMFHEIAQKMGIQIVIITDQDSLIEAADHNIKVINKKGVSIIE